MAPETSQRIDKWLWFARIVRTRQSAAGLVEAGQVRLNRNKVLKPGHDVTIGDTLTVALHGQVRVLKVGAAPRRGPAPTARLLYEELAMPNADSPKPQKDDASGAGNC